MSWTAADLPDLTDKTILITGATSGIGLEAAHHFAKRNATLILACRNASKTTSIISSIKSHTPTATIHFLPLDTSDLDSVRKCAQLFSETNIPHIDILLLNAGIAYGAFKTSAQGFELMFATNHLGHFLLTGLLLEYIRHRRDSRIISVASLGHKVVNSLQYDVIMGTNPTAYNQFFAYYQTKLANHWFVQDLNRKLVAMGSPTVAVPAHPGLSITSILNPHVPTAVVRICGTVMPFLLQPAEKGSWPLLMAASDPEITRTSHYGPSGMLEFTGSVRSDASFNPAVNDEAKADELWKKSEEMCHFNYSI